jgi:hypothetical protein
MCCIDNERVACFCWVAVWPSGDGEIQQEQWLVAACAGAGGSRDMAMEKRAAQFRLEPVAGVAVQFAFDPLLVIRPCSGLSVCLPLLCSASANLMPVRLAAEPSARQQLLGPTFWPCSSERACLWDLCLACASVRAEAFRQAPGLCWGLGFLGAARGDEDARGSEVVTAMAAQSTGDRQT